MATIDHIDNCSRMSLHLACKNQNLELIKILLKNGENPNAIDDKMFTPLHWACTSKSDVTVTIIELLRQHNANIEAAENECRQTPLVTAFLNILHHGRDFLLSEPSFTAEIERMKKKNIGNNEITLYNLLEKNISSLCQFVTDEEIQQQLKQEYLNKDFKFYKDIVRNRFREAIIQYTRNDLINQAIEYFRFNINQQLPNEILNCIFTSSSISELKCFVKSFEDALG